MSLRTFKSSFGLKKFNVKSIAVVMEEALIVSILGGEKPHVGAVAISIPRPSLKYPEKISSSTSIFTLIGHKEDELVKPVAELLVKELKRTTIVIAGIHVKNASEGDIKKLVDNSMKSIEKLIKKIKKFYK
ncbi:MAG: hypothetical protein QW723_05695, partial [Candidatus Bathyarchaeia archaeon]